LGLAVQLFKQNHPGKKVAEMRFPIYEPTHFNISFVSVPFISFVHGSYSLHEFDEFAINSLLNDFFRILF